MLSENEPTTFTKRKSANQLAYKVAIIGCGPKGLYGLERLLAELATDEIITPIEVHIFNKTPFFGAGDIYRCDQPSYLLMNYPNGNINMWPEDTSNVVVDHPLPYTEWLKNKDGTNTDDKNLAKEYSARAMVGQYLHDAYKQLTSQCPNNITIKSYQGEVILIQPFEKGYTLYFKSEGNPIQSVKHITEILLTTGHPSPLNGCTGAKQAKKTVNFVYPIDKKLNKVAPATKVAIKGMGLTFIDTALGLTEGRGGRFEEMENGNLKYVPSGLEPSAIYPFSTSGLPMIPRKGDYAIQQKPLKFFNRNNLAKKLSGRPDFEEELWPSILAEMKAAYYEVLFRLHNLHLDDTNDPITLQRQVNEFHQHHPAQKRFYWSTFTQPLQNTDENYHCLLTKYIAHTIEEAEKGVEHSPLAAAANAWRNMNSLFNEFYCFGGLNSRSQQLFDAHYAGHLNRITYGPPVVNMKKILALEQAEILDFSYARNPSIKFLEEKDEGVIRVNGSLLIDYLIDARIPKNNISENNITEKNSSLYTYLLTQGVIRPFTNKDDEGAFRPGCIDITKEGHPISKSGKVVENITLSGTLTEGVTYNNDTLSRAHNDFVSGWAKRVKDKYQMTNKTVEHAY